jgi:hypothetical protein
MSVDGSRGGRRRPRPLERATLPTSPLKDLKDLLHQLYLWADAPTLDEMEAGVAGLADELVRELGVSGEDVDALIGAAPKRDTISRAISGPELPASQQDVVAIAVALARMAGRLAPGSGHGDVAVVAGQVRELWVRARSEPLPRAGKPMGDYTPFLLEVHRSIDIGNEEPSSSLPQYVRRPHDRRLGAVVEAVIGGASRIAMLVGGSATGKTRACWEAIQVLPSRWWLWHPIDPGRPEAALAELVSVGPYTVVWLNDAQHYLHTADPVGERVAAGLRTLLADAARAPVLVLGTVWPQYWDVLVSVPLADDPDLHPHARELLAGADITVPDRFSSSEMADLAVAAANDRRLRHAADHAEAGRVTQHLAGVPELLRRYRNAPPAARAVIDAVIDARRLGHPLPIPRSFLEVAAPGYMHDSDWDHAGEDWLERALLYTGKPCHGTAGPLTRIRPRPGDDSEGNEPHYRLADALEQAGRVERVAVFPPAAFWTAVAENVTSPAVLRVIGEQAEYRGRYHRAAQLYAKAVENGDASALWPLARLREQAGDRGGAEDLYRRATTQDTLFAPLSHQALYQRLGTVDVGTLWEAENQADLDPATAAKRAADRGYTMGLWAEAHRLEREGHIAEAESKYRQAGERGDTASLADVARLREEDDDSQGAEQVALRAADSGDTSVLWFLAELRERRGDPDGAKAAVLQAAERGDKIAIWALAVLRERLGDLVGAQELYRLDADRGSPAALWSLAVLRQRSGDTAGAEVLYRQAADLGDTSSLYALGRLHEEAGDTQRAGSIYRLAADRGNIRSLLALAALRERAGDPDGAERLYQQAADRGDASALWSLAGMRHQAGQPHAAQALYRQAADLGYTPALLSIADLRADAGNLHAAYEAALEAANRGDNGALPFLAQLAERAGDIRSAERLRRFGLTDDGRSRASSFP